MPSVLIAAFQLSFEDHYKIILQPWFVSMTEIWPPQCMSPSGPRDISMYDWLSVLHINSEWGNNQIRLDPHGSWTRVGRDFQCVWCSSQWLCAREICVESRSHYAENEKDEFCNIIFSLQYVDPRLLSNWKSWQDWGIDSINAKESNSMWYIHSKESCVCLCCGIWCFCNGKVLESDGGESPYFCWLEYIFSYSKWVSESWVDWQGLRNVKEYKEQHVTLSSLKSLH